MSIDLSLNTTAEEIAQNVRIITTTQKGSQPFNRGLGLSSSAVDMPSARGMALLQAEIINELPRQEPRVNVKSVQFSGDLLCGEFEPVIDYEVVNV